MGKQYQILIIEDSPEDSEFYRRALESDPNNRYRVVEVNSGDEALALVPELAIDLVLLDFRLPDMTGLELFAKLCDDISSVVPTIMLTGQGNEGVAVKAMKLGVEDYLVKGQYSADGLRKAVEAIVRKPSEDGILEIGSIFAGRYEIVRLAGSGGMSSVYRALDRNTDTYVALKVVRSPDHRLSSRFRREASVLAELDNSTIVRYLGHGLTPDGDRFLAMEWLEGEDLATHLTHGPLSIEATMLVAQRVADALKSAHAHGLIHRDVKPSNLFLPGNKISQTKLLDFGIALTAEADMSRFTRTGTAMGTPGYMAPEQALGLQTIDHRADIYGLGALLYHCLTGKPPFTDRLGTGIRSLLDPATPVGELRTEIPAFLSSLVMSMLHREPQRRPRSAAAILTALRQRSTTETVTTRPCGPKRNRAQSARCTLLLATAEEMASVSFAHLDVLVRQREIIEAFGCKISEFSATDLEVHLPAKSSLTSELELGIRCAVKTLNEFPSLIIAIASRCGSSPSTRSRSHEQLDFARGLATKTSNRECGLILVDKTSAKLLKARYALEPRGPYFLLGPSLAQSEAYSPEAEARGSDRFA